MRVMVTGGAGFIGSAVCGRLAVADLTVLNVDKLTYAGTMTSLADVAALDNYAFLPADVCDADEMQAAVFKF